jgi:hypothetical protein
MEDLRPPQELLTLRGPPAAIPVIVQVNLQCPIEQPISVISK